MKLGDRKKTMTTIFFIYFISLVFVLQRCCFVCPNTLKCYLALSTNMLVYISVWCTMYVTWLLPHFFCRPCLIYLDIMWYIWTSCDTLSLYSIQANFTPGLIFPVGLFRPDQFHTRTYFTVTYTWTHICIETNDIIEKLIINESW
jgi:hypothetical protein